MRNIGKALTIISSYRVQEYLLHADVEAFNAPSECHEIISKGEIHRNRIAVRWARSVSGLNRRQFRRALDTVSPRTMLRLFDIILDKRYKGRVPYCAPSAHP